MSVVYSDDCPHRITDDDDPEIAKCEVCGKTVAQMDEEFWDDGEEPCGPPAPQTLVK